MKTLRILYGLLLICIVSIFIKCEQDPVNNIHKKQIDTNFLLSRIFQNDKLFQEYIYNENKKLIRIDYYFGDTVNNFETFEYDNEGRLNKRNYYDDYYTYEYDESGKYIRMKIYNKDGNVSTVAEFSYNNQNLIEKGTLKYMGFERETEYSYIYDLTGNVIKKFTSPIMYIEYKYDNKNNPRYNWGLPNDIVQYNNPVKYYVRNDLSCSMPPNYTYYYEYNVYGYPVKEYRTVVNTDIVDIFRYEYME